MRIVASILAIALIGAGPAAAQEKVKPDEKVVARLAKALEGAASEKAGSPKREAALADVRGAPKVERFEALARSLERSGKKDLRLLAADEMARTGERAGAAILAGAIVREADPKARAAITRSLRALDEKDAAPLFAAYLADSDPKRRVRAMQGLAVFRDRRSVAPLVRFIEEITLSARGTEAVAYYGVDHSYISSWRLISGGTGLAVVEVADPEVDIMRSGVAVEVNVRRIEMRFATALLEDLTGEKHGNDAKMWRTWLETHPDLELAPPREERKAEDR